MSHPADLPAAELLRVCDTIRTRRSGPGGQHRNKVETAIVLTHRPTGLQAEAGERRSQSDNLRVATFRLRLLLALEVRTEREASSIPSPLWTARCVQGRLQINPEHDDFPALLAEALDVLAQQAFDVPTAADLLGCTSSQLLKLLKREPRAFLRVNQERHAIGLSRLR